MKSNIVVVLLLLTCMALGGLFYGYWWKSKAELVELRAENEELVEQNLKMQEAVVAQEQAGSEEVAQLKHENAELLRLRNEVRQLREERKALGVQVQSAQQQVQQVQEQANAAEQRLAAQIETMTTQAAQVAQGGALPQVKSTAEEEMFRRRYGLAPQTSPQELCINLLRQIDGAKQQWALENRKPDTSVPTPQDLAPYLRGGVPSCPQSGIYILHAVNTSPTCTVPGHALPR